MQVFRTIIFPGGGGEAIFSSLEKAEVYCSKFPAPRDGCYHIYTHTVDESGYTFMKSIHVKNPEAEWIHVKDVSSLLKEVVKEAIQETKDSESSTEKHHSPPPVLLR